MKMKMKGKRAALSYLLLFSSTANLVGAFTVPKHPNERYMSSGNRERSIICTELQLFRPYQSRSGFSDDYPQRSVQKSTQVMKRISQKLKLIRLFLSVRFSFMMEKYKKRYLPILAAAMITAGSFPSRSFAEMSTKTEAMSKIVVTNIRTSMDLEIKKSIAKTSFLQYDTKAPNNYFEDVDLHNLFDTNIQIVSEETDVLEKDDVLFVEENSDVDEFETAIIDSTSPVSIVEDGAKIQETVDDVMVLNDRMLKNGLKSVAVVSSGAVGLLALSKKAARPISEEDDNDDEVHVDVRDENGKSFSPEIENNIGQFADCEADKEFAIPLHKTYFEARKQPKSPKEEAILAARYAAIPTVEERAYQILIDLGMI